MKIIRFKPFFIILMIIILLLWSLNIVMNPYPKITIYNIHKELLNLTGLAAYFLMGVVMFLSLRPKFIEKYFNGLDKIYLHHKWLGVWSIIFSALHYLISLSKQLFPYFIEVARGSARGGRGGSGVPYPELKPIAAMVAEYAVWFLVAFLLITFWKRINYLVWRYIHKVLPIFFLLIAFHSIIFMPGCYWATPAGWIIIGITLIGGISAIISLSGLIGIQHRHKATITHIEYHQNEVIEVECEIKGKWQHIAGQYAFLRSNRFEGAHPFTIASADQNNNCIRFYIKSLGRYTEKLWQGALNVDDEITIEGPYGCFNFREATQKEQVWIGAGIGITPFIAWLEELKKDNDLSYDITLYYALNNQSEADLVPKIKGLIEDLPNVKFIEHYSDESGFLSIDQLNLSDESMVAFCGPDGFAMALRSDLIIRGVAVDEMFHQENFQMR